MQADYHPVEQDTIAAMARSVDAHRDKISQSSKLTEEAIELAFLDGVQFGLKLAKP